MHVLDPKELQSRRIMRAKKLRHRHFRRGGLLFIVIILVAYSSAVMILPVPALRAKASNVSQIKQTPINLPWPGYGQAALGAVGYGLLASNGAETPLPIASVAKILTALTVLETKPLDPSKPAVITMSADDVANYYRLSGQGQSAVAVVEGEDMTQYQALQALLLPSANNIADTLAIWAFGSVDTYLTTVNKYTKAHGLKNTHIADTSGFSPQTTGTAVDLAVLAELALKQPTIAEIVSQPYADLPIAGRVFNVNRLVGRDGVIGIKTGNTDEAGGCYVFALTRKLDASRPVTIYGSIVGAPNLNKAIDDSLPLMDASFKGFSVVNVVKISQVFGSLSQRGAPDIPIVASNDLSVVAWQATPPRVEVSLHNPGSSVSAGEEVGQLIVYSGKSSSQLKLVAKSSTIKHTPLWRLRHAAGYL